MLEFYQFFSWCFAIIMSTVIGFTFISNVIYAINRNKDILPKEYNTTLIPIILIWIHVAFSMLILPKLV